MAFKSDGKIVARDRDVYAPYVRVGAAIGTQHTLGRDPSALELVARQFNTITPDNLLKWQSVHPAPDRYKFEPSDKFVEWGEKNNMFIVGHALSVYVRFVFE